MESEPAEAASTSRDAQKKLVLIASLAVGAVVAVAAATILGMWWLGVTFSLVYCSAIWQISHRRGTSPRSLSSAVLVLAVIVLSGALGLLGMTGVVWSWLGWLALVAFAASWGAYLVALSRTRR